MYCPACGNEIPDNSKFCEHCGEKTGAAAPASKPKEESGWASPSMESESPEGRSDLPVKTSSPGGGYIPRDIKLDPIELLKGAWDVFSADMSPIIIFSLVYLIASAVCGFTIIGIFAMPGIMAGYMLCYMGYIRRKEQLDIGKMFQTGWPFYVNMLVYMIVGGLISGLATVCLILPGMMAGLGFAIGMWLIVDKNASFGDAINATFALISKHYYMLLIFALLIVAIYIIPAILSTIPFVGALIMFAASLVMSPVITIATFKAYEKLFD